MAAFRRLDLNFCDRKSRPSALGATALVAGIAAMSYVTLQTATAYAAWESERSQYAALQSSMETAVRVDRSLDTASPAEIQALHGAQLIDSQLRTPWARLLKLLETVPVEHVALLAIEPVAARRQLRLSVEAKDLASMVDYLAFLQQQQPTLTHVALMSHQVQRQEAGNPVRFQIRAQWDGQ